MTTPKLKPGSGGYRILFWTIAGLLILRPILQEISAESWLLPVFFTTVLLAGVWAVSRNRRQLIALGILALIAIGGHWGNLMSAWPAHDAISHIASTVCLGWIAVILSQDVFRERDSVSADMIYGGVNVYLLIGLAFSSAYAVQATLMPGSINGLSADSLNADTIYFSFVTITTLGYGDISPVADNARMLASGEAVLGQLYVAILLARLVAVHISGRQGS